MYKSPPATSPSATLSDFELLTIGLQTLTDLPGLTEYRLRIDTLIQSIKNVSDYVGLSFTNYCEVPKVYVETFLDKSMGNSPANLEAQKVYLRDMLSTIESYIDLIFKMAKETPKKEQKTQQSLLFNKPKCSLEKFGRDMVLQKGYYCETCNITGDGMICEGCVVTCHKDHKTAYRGMLTGFCDCRFDTNQCKLMESCTLKQTGSKMINQPRYTCHSCQMNVTRGKMLCKYCVENCHKGHAVELLGIVSGFCDCDEMYSFCLLNKNGNNI